MTISYQVELCQRKEICSFMEKWHYSHNMNGVDSIYCFKLLEFVPNSWEKLDNHRIVGGAVFGFLGMPNQWKKYTDDPKKIIELRRLCCIDDTPKNTESYFISKCLKWLKKNTKIEKILSYADPEFGHEGIIYQASSFDLIGKTSAGRVIWYNGKRYHDKILRSDHGHGYVDPKCILIKKELENGNAHYQKTKPKNIYLKIIRKKW